ncbi:hypothetical protein PR003_g31069 [Phytophthora rubi]|uniref:Uncharacterized protein n=1 Tax=Phytophthora rubi TaxID=129364 RepID=A0A6A4BCN4_9STRA|nr:hypothetical protein PR003_g31069 [Phytophthora rubi]
MAVATLEEEDDDLLHSAQGRAAVTEDQLLFSELDEVSDMLQLDLAAPTPIDPPVGVAQVGAGADCCCCRPRSVDP